MTGSVKRIILPFIALLCAGILSAQESVLISLTDCVARALKNNSGLEGARLEMDAARSSRDAASMLYLPSLTVSAGYTRLNSRDPATISVPPLGTVELSPAIEDNWLLRLELRQNLFTGFKVNSTVELAGASYSAAAASYEQERANTVFTVTKSYLELVKAIDYLEVVKESVTATEARVAEVKALYTQGLVTNNEVLKAELALADVRLRRIDGENNVSLARARLAVLVGLPASTLLTPEAFVPRADSGSIENQDASLEEAYSRRPEVRLAESRIAAGEAGIANAAAAFYPAVILKGNYTYANPNPSLFPLQPEWNGTWEVGIALSVDLGAYPGTLFRVEEARARRDRAVAGYTQVKEGISLQVLQSRLDLEKARDRLAVGNKMVDQAGENLRVMTEKRKNGLATNTDVLDARISFLQAKLFFRQAAIDFEIARVTFDYRRGTLWKTE